LGIIESLGDGSLAIIIEDLADNPANNSNPISCGLDDCFAYHGILAEDLSQSVVRICRKSFAKTSETKIFCLVE
jgi:hypothetical protein